MVKCQGHLLRFKVKFVSMVFFNVQLGDKLFIVCQFDLIEKCIFKLFSELTKRDVPGFAIGGLSGGESKDEFWKIVNISTDYLPKEKPRYLMGVG